MDIKHQYPVHIALLRVSCFYIYAVRLGNETLKNLRLKLTALLESSVREESISY